MKVTIDDKGQLTLDCNELVESLDEKTLRTLSKFAVFQQTLLDGVVEALVDGQMFSNDEENAWWYGGDTFQKLRLKVLELLPAISAEAVRHLVADALASRKERDAWKDACWMLEREWDENRRERERGYGYEYRRPMSKEDAAAYLQKLEERLAAEKAKAAP